MSAEKAQPAKTTALEEREVSPDRKVEDTEERSESSTSATPKVEEVAEIDADLEDENDPEIAELPPYVRRVVTLHDDTSLFTLTFRYFVVSTLFVVPGAFLSQMNTYRTLYAPYSVFFVQIASNYVGPWLAKVLPKKQIRIAFTRFSFSLNPGPWSVKEHVLVTVTANSGAISNLGASSISLAELYFDNRIHPAAAIFFMWSIVGLGYAYTAIARQVLLYEPAYPWYQSLCQSALFETQRRQLKQPTKLAKKQMRIFWGVLLGVTLWQFLPEYVFPMVSSLAFLCWVAPRNEVANFIGSGLGGMGLLNLSFDWANISAYNYGVPLFLSPWWTQVVFFISFVFCAWILIPAAKFGGLGYWHHGLMSNRVLTEDGSKYPIQKLVTPQNTFNETAYEINGPIFEGVQILWATFFDVASYTSGYVWVLLFGWTQLRSAFKKFRSRRESEGKGINHQYQDRLNVLMRPYPEVPLWWYVVLFFCCFVPLLVIVSKGILYIPVWTLFIALAIGAITIIPFGWLFAVSNYQLQIGTFNELIYGAMIEGLKSGSHRNPVGASVYGAIAGDVWYRAQYMLQDQKIGHYMHVPQRAIFVSQVWGMLIGIPVNYGAIRWILNTKRDYLNGNKDDPAKIWTGQSLVTTLTTGTQYVVIGPSRLFKMQIFKPLPYGFLVGAGLPVILFLLHKYFPRARFDLWNTTVFFSGASIFYGNITTGYFSRFVGGFVVAFWAYRYRYELWNRYNFILAAAFDTGFNLNMLLIFLFFGAGKTIKMPYWWGNNETNPERCFALDS